MPFKKGEYEKVLESPMRVKYKDVFEMKAFYESLHEWCLQYGWMDLEEDKDHFETFYGEKIDKNGAKELWIQWRVYKDAEGAPLRYYLDFHYHVLGLTPTEVVKEGIKLKAHKGEMELTMNGYVERKYQKDFKKNTFLNEILGLFNKRIYRKEFEQRKKELYQEMYVLQNFIKQWFKLKRYLPYEEARTMFSSYAWPSHLKE